MARGRGYVAEGKTVSCGTAFCIGNRHGICPGTASAAGGACGAVVPNVAVASVAALPPRFPRPLASVGARGQGYACRFHRKQTRFPKRKTLIQPATVRVLQQNGIDACA